MTTSSYDRYIVERQGCSISY